VEIGGPIQRTLRRRATAATSGSGRAALEEFSAVALRTPPEISSSEEPDTDGIDEDFSIVPMSGSYLLA
jgi:hypothetical protein